MSLQDDLFQSVLKAQETLRAALDAYGMIKADPRLQNKEISAKIAVAVASAKTVSVETVTALDSVDVKPAGIISKIVSFFTGS